MKILLIGDSIRMGYDKYVQEKLAGHAEVFFNGDNARFAEYTFRTLSMWKEQMKIDNVDAVHWNTGLWDTLRLYGDFRTLTDPEVYADYIDRIERRIEFLFPGAKVIFATSTPVWEEKFDPTEDMRYNRDIEAFNKIAVDVLSKYPVTINDLYALMRDKPNELHSDMTHYYTPEGTEILGSQVVRVLCDVLNINL